MPRRRPWDHQELTDIGWSNKCSRYSRSMEGHQQRADWRRVEALYRQFASIAMRGDETHIPRVLSGALAEELGRVVASYERNEETFARDAYAVLGHVDR